MAVQAGAGGTILTGALVADASFAAKVYDGSALFVGSGNLSAIPFLQLNAVSDVFAASGNLAADLAKPPLEAGATFAAVGSLLASAAHFTAGLYDETGATGSLSISAGAFTELEFGLQLDTATVANGDVLSFRVYRDGIGLSSYDATPGFTVSGLPVYLSAAFTGAGILKVDTTIQAAAIYGTGLFAGAGNLLVTPQLLAMAQAAFAGSGDLSAAPQLRMRSQFGIFGASGSLIVDTSIAGLISASALFAGLGTLTGTAKLRMVANLSVWSSEGQAIIAPWLRMRGSTAMSGTGSLVADLKILEAIYQGSVLFTGTGDLSADSIRFINATDESFAGIGLLDAASALFLPSDAVFGAEGLLSVETQNQMFAEIAFSAFGSMVADAQRYGSDAGRFICDLDADMTMGDLMAAIATNSLNTTTETNSLNTTIRCH